MNSREGGRDNTGGGRGSHHRDRLSWFACCKMWGEVTVGLDFILDPSVRSSLGCLITVISLLDRCVSLSVSAIIKCRQQSSDILKDFSIITLTLLQRCSFDIQVWWRHLRYFRFQTVILLSPWYFKAAVMELQAESNFPEVRSQPSPWVEGQFLKKIINMKTRTR